MLADFEEQEGVNLEAFNIPLRDWIAKPQVRKEMRRRFRMFLVEFRDGEDFNVSLSHH